MGIGDWIKSKKEDVVRTAKYDYRLDKPKKVARIAASRTKKTFKASLEEMKKRRQEEKTHKKKKRRRKK